MSWQDAVLDAPGGCALLLEASPGAKRAEFPDGFNPWRGRIGVAVRAAAQDGKANAEVVAAVSDFFGAPAQLASGATDRRKRVEVAVPRAVALAALEGHL